MNTRATLHPCVLVSVRAQGAHVATAVRVDTPPAALRRSQPRRSRWATTGPGPVWRRNRKPADSEDRDSGCRRAQGRGVPGDSDSCSESDSNGGWTLTCPPRFKGAETVEADGPVASEEAQLGRANPTCEGIQGQEQVARLVKSRIACRVSCAPALGVTQRGGEGAGEGRPRQALAGWLKSALCPRRRSETGNMMWEQLAWSDRAKAST
jgi:hypothetical protein